jgi:15-cis-phytoene synthase
MPRPADRPSQAGLVALELDRLYAGTPATPGHPCAAPAIAAYGIDRANQLEEILDGMEMDLGPDRYADFSSLRLYCHRVAGVVGEVAARHLRLHDHATLKYAARLGLAFQLTNILRDVGEDARRGRLYLPQDELAALRRQRRPTSSPAATTTAFQRLMAFQYRRAHRHLRRGHRPPAGRRPQGASAPA